MDEKTEAFLATLHSPRYTSADHDPSLPFALTGVLNGVEVEFFASPGDVHDYGREVYDRVSAGELGEIGDYVEPPPVEFPPVNRGAK